MDYVKKSENSLVVMQNGKIIESDKTQIYENPRERKVQGIHNGKAFVYIQKKPKFSLFPEKHVSFQHFQYPKRISYKIRSPTPYPISKKHKKKSKKRIQKKNPKQNITKKKN